MPVQVEVFYYGYASPRVGNGAFCAEFLEGTGNGKVLQTVAVAKVDKGYRFTHKGDLVPAVPPTWMFGLVACTTAQLSTNRHCTLVRRYFSTCCTDACK